LSDEMVGNQGIFRYANGDRFEGQVLNGQKHGDGIYVFANGNKYIGMFACPVDVS